MAKRSSKKLIVLLNENNYAYSVENIDEYLGRVISFGYICFLSFYNDI